MAKIGARNKDYTLMDLPKNRWELFFDIVKNNFRKFIVIGLILILFSAPYIIVSIYKDSTALSFYQQRDNGLITDQELYDSLTLNNLLFNAINSISLGIVGLGFAGIVKIIKRLCFLDPVFFLYDMKSGIKDNGLLMFLTFFTYGIIRLLSQYLNISFSNSFVATIPLGIKYVIILPTFLLLAMSLAVYNLKFARGLYNSFLLYFKTFLKTILACIIFALPFLVLLIQVIAIKYIVFGLVIIIIEPFFLLGFFDYCCSIFDKHINKTIYPEIYRKGLRQEQTNESND